MNARNAGDGLLVTLWMATAYWPIAHLSVPAFGLLFVVGVAMAVAIDRWWVMALPAVAGAVLLVVILVSSGGGGALGFGSALVAVVALTAGAELPLALGTASRRLYASANARR